MPEMIAFCGVDCGQCKAFKARATQAKDAERKGQLTGRWTEGMKIRFNSEDIERA